MKVPGFVLPWLLFLAGLSSAVSQPKIDSLHSAIALYPSSDTIKVDLLNQLGYEYWVVSPARSEHYGTQAMQLADSLGYSVGQAFANRVVGVSHWARGNYEQSLQFLLLSFEGYKKLGDKLGEANVIMNIGLVYADQNNFEKALQNYFDAIKLFEQLGKKDRIGTTYTKIGSIYLQQQQLDLAYEYFTKALALHREVGFRYGISEVTNRLGQLFLQRRDTDKAIEYLSESLNMSMLMGDKENAARNQAQIGNILTEKGNLKEAEAYLKQALQTSHRNDLKKISREVYGYYKQLYLKRGDYKTALQYSDAYMSISDSLFNEEKAAQIANLQTSYELREMNSELLLKQKEIDLLEANARFDSWLRLSLIGGVTTLLVVGFLVISRQRLKIRSEKQISAKAEALLRSAKELAEAQLENAGLREQELVRELEFKNKELTSYTINFIRKNELLEELTKDIQKLRESADPALSKKLFQLNKNVENTLQVDKDWEDFKRYFESVHSQFFVRLKEGFPELTPTDLKMCALIHMNLSMKEMATILGISPESVKTSRYRLRKKLGLEHEDNLLTFLFDIGQKESVQHP